MSRGEEWGTYHEALDSICFTEKNRLIAGKITDWNAYKEHLTLQRTVGLNNVGDLNVAIQKGMAQEIVLVSEAMQEKQVAKIAEEIAAPALAGAPPVVPV